MTIRNVATGQTIIRTTTGSGVYDSGPLNPGNYTVSVSAQGFSAVNLPTVVTIGNISPGNIKLGVASEKQVQPGTLYANDWLRAFDLKFMCVLVSDK